MSTTRSSNSNAAETPAPEVKPKSTGGRFLKCTLWTVGILAGTVAVLAIIGMVLPSTFAIRRSVVVDAAPPDIHPYVADLRKWPDWTPYNAEENPGLEFEYGDEFNGMVLSETWTDPKWGSGELKIDEQNAENGIRYVMSMDGMEKPMKGSISYSRDGEGFRVTWSSRGTMPSDPFNRWMYKLFVVPQMEKSFDSSLAKLKERAEADYLVRRKEVDAAAQAAPEPDPEADGGRAPKRPAGKAAGKRPRGKREGKRPGNRGKDKPPGTPQRPPAEDDDAKTPGEKKDD